MKRKITCILLVFVLLFTFSSCENRSNKPVVRTLALGPKESYVKPVKREHSPEDQQIIDYYYSEMISLYPQFGTIPREMLVEGLYRYPANGAYDVNFVFYFGGAYTPCKCTFSTNGNPEGIWKVNENIFSQYYQLGLDENVMSEIRSLLFNEVSEFVDKYRLEKSKSFSKSSDELFLLWGNIDGKIFCACEEIAYVTKSTKKKYKDCEHLHISARVTVEISDDSVKLTASCGDGL